MNWFDTSVTLILGLIGVYFAYSLRRQTAAKVADKRFDSYAALWAKTKIASPMLKTPLTADDREMLFRELTDWYYDKGNGMLLAEETRNVYLAAKKNLICPIDDLIPHSLREQVSRSSNPDGARSKATKRQLSLLRTAMRADIAIYTGPWGPPLDGDDRDFLKACGVNLRRPAWCRPRFWAQRPRADESDA